MELLKFAEVLMICLWENHTMRRYEFWLMEVITLKVWRFIRMTYRMVWMLCSTPIRKKELLKWMF